MSAGVLLSAVLLRVNSLAEVSFWFDEACSWRISGFSWADMWDAIQRDAHPPVFYLLERNWQGLFGKSVIAARSLSTCCGLLTVGAGWWLAHEMLSGLRAKDPETNSAAWFPLLTATFLAWNALQIELSQEARPYELMVFLSLVASVFLLKGLRGVGTIAPWAGFSISVTLLSLTHYYGLLSAAALLFVAAVEIAVAWLVRESDSAGARRLAWRRVSGLLLSFGLMQLCWIPWWETFAWQRSRANSQLWMSPLTWDALSTAAWGLLAGGKVSANWSGGGWGAIGCWVLVPALMLRQGRGGRLIACCIGLPVVACLTYSLCVRNILGVRYLAAPQAYFLIGTAFLLSLIPRPFWRRSTVLMCLAWTIYWSYLQARQRAEFTQSAGLRQAFAYINEHRRQDEPVVIATPFVFASAEQLLRPPAPLRLHYLADPRQDLLGGPLIRPEDLRVSEVLDPRPVRVWTVDAEDLFMRDPQVKLPEPYSVCTERAFVERFGIWMTVVVRSHCRDAVATTSQLIH